MTGSSFPCLARAVRSAHSARALVAILVRVVDPLVAADLAQGLEQGVPPQAVLLQELARRALGLEKSQQQVFRRDILVLQGLGFAKRLLEDAVQPGGYLGGGPLRSRKRRKGPLGLRLDRPHAQAQLAERRGHDPALLGEERLQEMLGGELRVIAALGLGLSRSQGFLGFYGELVEAHGKRLLSPLR
jgi:hypothetical protein